MNNRHVTIRSNIWRACFIGFVVWFLFFRPNSLSFPSIYRLLPDVRGFDDLHAIVAYAMFGIVFVAVVKLITQSR